MQKIMITGNLGHSATSETDTNGITRVKFSVAVRVGTKASPLTVWWNVSITGDYGIRLLPYLKHGTKVLVDGTPSITAYKNKKEEILPGLTIWAKEVELLSSKSDESTSDTASTIVEDSSSSYADEDKRVTASDDVPF